MKLFTTKEPLDVLSRFTADIEQIGKEIQERLVLTVKLIAQRN